MQRSPLWQWRQMQQQELIPGGGSTIPTAADTLAPINDQLIRNGHKPITLSYFRGVERGRFVPSRGLVRAWAMTAGVTVEWLESEVRRNREWFLTKVEGGQDGHAGPGATDPRTDADAPAGQSH